MDKSKYPEISERSSPDNGPSQIPYGIGMGNHGPGPVRTGKGNPASIPNGRVHGSPIAGSNGSQATMSTVGFVQEGLDQSIPARAPAIHVSSVLRQLTVK